MTVHSLHISVTEMTSHNVTRHPRFLVHSNKTTRCSLPVLLVALHSPQKNLVLDSLLSHTELNKLSGLRVLQNIFIPA